VLSGKISVVWIYIVSGIDEDLKDRIY